MIPLIDKLDGFETIGLKIAEILALEQTYQQALAVEASKDPALWAFKVFHERSNPWESYLYDDADTTPIVNIWYNNSSIDEKKSSGDGYQTCYTSRFNVDCYVSAVHEETETGHLSGDELAAKSAQRIGRIVRNILAHEKYRNLGITGDYRPWRKFVTSLEMFQPATAQGAIQSVMGFRLAVEVDHNETILERSYETLDGVDVTFQHEPDGLVHVELKYDYGED